MRPLAIEAVIQRMATARAPAVLELGAGLSTVFLARAAHEHGGRLVSIEHSRRWAGRVRRLLRREGLTRSAHVLRVPLEPLPESLRLPEVEGMRRPDAWYDVDRLRDACGERLDLLLVDGPPGTPEVLVRAPALPALVDRLAPGATVFLDDIGRPEERRAAAQWQQMLGGGLELRDDADVAVITSSGKG